MTGRPVAEQIRKSRPEMKVLHVSAYAIEELIQKQGLLPDAEFLAKPFLPTVMVQKVKQILAGSCTVPSSVDAAKDKMRIPSDADQRSEGMAIAIPN